MKHTLIPLLTLAPLLLASCAADDVDYDASGVFEATEVIVSAKAQGEIVLLNVDEGQTVTPADTLGRIDITQLAIKRQQLQQSRQANDDKRLNLDSQVASLQQQIANTQREKQRYQALLDQGAATQKQVDDMQYQISVLQRQLAATTEQINANNTSLASNSRSITNQISGVDQQSSDAIITSPITGTILTKYAEQGEYASPGRALFKVADINDMKLRAYVTADLVANLRLGQAATVYADDGKTQRRTYQGTVSWSSDQA